MGGKEITYNGIKNIYTYSMIKKKVVTNNKKRNF